MSALAFHCPRSGETIDAGIEADAQTLHRLNVLFVRVPCPHCRYDHLRQIKSCETRASQFACDEPAGKLRKLIAAIGG